MAIVKSIALLLDSAPRTWTSQEEIHLRLCRALTEQGIQPVLVFAQPVAPELAARLAAGGAQIEVISYGQGARHYYRELGRVIWRYDVGIAHVADNTHDVQQMLILIHIAELNPLPDWIFVGPILARERLADDRHVR